VEGGTDVDDGTLSAVLKSRKRRFAHVVHAHQINVHHSAEALRF
jgi:hypothetical protein